MENKTGVLSIDEELEAWAKTTWRLKGGVLIAFLNKDLLYLEFGSKVEARVVGLPLYLWTLRV